MAAPVVRWMAIWAERVLYALMTAGIVVSVAMAIYSLNLSYFNDPPIELRSLESPSLGSLCPGQESMVRLFVTVHEPIILHYYLSVMRTSEDSNVIGTQQAYTDILHPRPAAFEMSLPWVVPELEPGHYVRVVASRNVAGHQNTVYSLTSFEIGDC